MRCPSGAQLTHISRDPSIGATTPEVVAREREVSMRGHSMALAIAVALAGCGPEEPPIEVPILTPEPAGAPTALAQGRLTCLGNNEAPVPNIF